MSHEVQLITKDHESGKGISILSFDGGGPGTLSQVLILKDLFRRLEYDLNVEEDTLRPADYFDVMGGVGFGGLSALMLGRLRMGLEKTMEELTTIGTIVFPHSPSETTTSEGKTARLRGAIEAMLQRNGYPLDIKLKDKALRGSACKVVVFAATLETRCHCHPFRTYASRYGSTDCSFVDVACATLVMPDLFLPIAIGPSWARQKFVGTPFGYNNPMRQVLQEARLDFGDEKQVALLLSLGSGRPNEVNLDSQHPDRHIDFLTHIAYDCERVARELSDQLCGVGAYKRLNLNRGVENIQMFDWHELGAIASHTAVYLQSSAIMDEVDFCSDALQNRTAEIALGQLNRTGVAILAKFNPSQYGNHLALSPMAIKQIGDIVRGGVKGITLVDAIGNFIPISMELCRTYSMLKDVIGAYFRHQRPPGCDLVERGDYRLVYGDSRSKVEPMRWTYTVNAGLTVEMSMVLRKHNGNRTTCPRCDEEYYGEAKDGWVDWKFQLENESAEKMEDVEDLISPAISSQGTRSGSTRSPSPNSIQTSRLTEAEKKKLTEDERKQFRLISVINLLDVFPGALDIGEGFTELIRRSERNNESPPKPEPKPIPPQKGSKISQIFTSHPDPSQSTHLTSDWMSLLSRRKLQSTSTPDANKLLRKVLLRNSISRVDLALADARSTSSLEVQPDPERHQTLGTPHSEPYTGAHNDDFVFPDASLLDTSRMYSMPDADAEVRWLDSLLEDLGDDGEAHSNSSFTSPIHLSPQQLQPIQIR